MFSNCMQESYKSANYVAMYYKNGNNIGIRRKKPRPGEKSGKQIWTFGSGTGLSKDSLLKWAGRTLKHLDEGNSEDSTREWINTFMEPFRQ